MKAPWNPPQTLPFDQRVVLLFNFPTGKGDGGYHVPVAHVGSFDSGRQTFVFTGPPPKQVHTYPLAWLAGWMEVPS